MQNIALIILWNLLFTMFLTFDIIYNQYRLTPDNYRKKTMIMFLINYKSTE